MASGHDIRCTTISGNLALACWSVGGSDCKPHLMLEAVVDHMGTQTRLLACIQGNTHARMGDLALLPAFGSHLFCCCLGPVVTRSW
jgi:hypothetical protein